jgi:hypothetical protein
MCIGRFGRTNPIRVHTAQRLGAEITLADGDQDGALPHRNRRLEPKLYFMI